MATLTFGGDSYTVDHVVKGSNFIHGYDNKNRVIVSFEGVSDFSNYSYSGSYQSPTDVALERTVRFTTTAPTEGAASSEPEGSLVFVYV